MAWPSTVSGDVLSGRGAKTVIQELFTRAREAIGGGTGFYFVAVTETGTSFADKATHQIRIPESVRSGDTIQLTIIGTQTGGGVGTYRARETGTPVNGTEQVIAGLRYTSVITVPDDTWAGATKAIAVQLKTDGTGTAGANTVRLMANLRFQTA